ncbi:MAG: electron transport complex protein RnfC, partial [Flavobacteriales bacterium]
QPVIMGGPMMGFSVSSELVPIVKTSNCILVPSKVEMPSAFEKESKEVECIRCGQCSDVCPSQLLPQELQWSAKAKDHAQLKKLNLSDCIDCGACAYVCPSQIPLVHYYRIAKAEILEQQQLDLKAEKAKTRFEARKLRLEKEKVARQEKQKKAAAARKSVMNKATPEATGAKSAVAAALARVKAKKASKDQVQQQTNTPDSQTNLSSDVAADQKSQVSAAIARAKAKKKLKAEATNTLSSDNNDANKTVDALETKSVVTLQASVDDKKAKIAVAIAKAKAKKLNKTTDAADTNKVTEHTLAVNMDAKKAVNIEDKKVKIAAAIAKVKSKALANANKENKETDDTSRINSPVTNNETQAKYKPAELVQTEQEYIAVSDSIDNSKNKNITESKPIIAIDKKAKIIAAIAKVKAKKKLKEISLVEKNNPDNV